MPPRTKYYYDYGRTRTRCDRQRQTGRTEWRAREKLCRNGTSCDHSRSGDEGRKSVAARLHSPARADPARDHCVRSSRADAVNMIYVRVGRRLYAPSPLRPGPTSWAAGLGPRHRHWPLRRRCAVVAGRRSRPWRTERTFVQRKRRAGPVRGDVVGSGRRRRRRSRPRPEGDARRTDGRRDGAGCNARVRNAPSLSLHPSSTPPVHCRWNQ